MGIHGFMPVERTWDRWHFIKEAKWCKWGRDPNSELRRIRFAADSSQRIKLVLFIVKNQSVLAPEERLERRLGNVGAEQNKTRFPVLDSRGEPGRCHIA